MTVSKRVIRSSVYIGPDDLPDGWEERVYFNGTVDYVNHHTRFVAALVLVVFARVSPESVFFILEESSVKKIDENLKVLDQNHDEMQEASYNPIYRKLFRIKSYHLSWKGGKTVSKYVTRLKRKLQNGKSLELLLVTRLSILHTVVDSQTANTCSRRQHHRTTQRERPNAIANSNSSSSKPANTTATTTATTITTNTAAATTTPESLRQQSRNKSSQNRRAPEMSPEQQQRHASPTNVAPAASQPSNSAAAATVTIEPERVRRHKSFMSRNELHGPSSVLPEGYEQRTTPQGQIYFMHTQTGVSSWHDPRVPRNLNHIDATDLGPLPPGWELRSTATGRLYYVCHTSRTTQFTDPRISRYMGQLHSEIDANGGESARVRVAVIRRCS